ncbi:hypothetical protein [Acaryochloris marina]|uniref:hypothetical protein n=1 Tax=Acaryochloris marina TaxID=155978 RepID=UPI00164F601A|nr:hypothetical protein [Acaryochloris marina]
MNKQKWNSIQSGRVILRLKALGCLSNHSQSIRSGCEPGQYHKCQACGHSL